MGNGYIGNRVSIKSGMFAGQQGVVIGEEWTTGGIELTVEFGYIGDKKVGMFYTSELSFLDF